jgi:hypothetical protein
LLAVPDVLVSGDEKRRLGSRWEAVAADMESGGVAQAAAEASLPLAAVKCITDAADQSMVIDFRRCRSEHGELSPWKIVREGLRNRDGLRDLLLLASNSRRAARNLALSLRSA